MNLIPFLLYLAEKHCQSRRLVLTSMNTHLPTCTETHVMRILHTRADMYSTRKKVLHQHNSLCWNL